MVTYQLVDAYGRPVRRQELSREHGEPGMIGVRPVFAGAVAAGLTPQRLASVLAACDRGDIHDAMILFEEMEERDPHYGSVLGQRKRAISGVDPTVEAAGEDERSKRIADWTRDHIAEHDDLPDLIEDLLDAVGKGFSAVEIDWGTSPREWVPRGFHWRHQSYFQVEREHGQELRLRDLADPNGLPLAPFKWMLHTARTKSGSVYRGGVARIAVFSWMCKAYTLKDWMAFVELYGLPLRVGKYGPGATKGDINALFRAVANIGTDAAAVIPEGMDIEFIGATGGGASSSQPVFENLARFADEQVSKIVIGQTMTADQGSSMAQAKVHNDVRYDIAASDARRIEGVLNRELVRPAVDLNFGPQAAYPKLSIEIAEPEDIKTLSEAVGTLAGAGLTFGAKSMRKRLGLPDPEKDEEVFGGAAAPAPAPAPPPVPPQGKPDLKLVGRADARELPVRNPMDELEAEMADEWRDAMDPFIAPILAAMEVSPTVEEFSRRLDAMDGLPKGPLIDQLVKGMFRARALGDMRDG